MPTLFRHLEFEAYLRRAREQVRAAHTINNESNIESILNTNAPYEVNPEPSNQHGVILIHGLLDSPYCMLSLEQYLSKQGFVVKSLLLKDHGTIPSDLMNTHYQQWIYQVLVALDSFEDSIEKVSIMGLSTGALLALKAALLYPTKISSLVLFSPAFKIRPLPQMLLPLIFAMKGLFPWVVKVEENDPTKYRSVTTNAAYQVRQLGKMVRYALQKNPVLPNTFLVLSEDDETISVGAALEAFKRLNTSQKHLYLYANRENEELKNQSIVQSCYPSKKILNFSHVCLTNAPDHPHYGEKNNSSSHYKGAITARNLYRYPTLNRNTFNPDFNQLLEKIDKFIR